MKTEICIPAESDIAATAVIAIMIIMRKSYHVYVKHEERKHYGAESSEPYPWMRNSMLSVMVVSHTTRLAKLVSHITKLSRGYVCGQLHVTV